MQSFLPSPTSVRRAAARMRTVNAIGVVSATLCTYAFHPKSWQAHYDTLNAWNGDSTPRRIPPAKVVGSRAIVAQMAEVRALRHGTGAEKVVEKAVIASEGGTETAAK